VQPQHWLYTIPLRLRSLFRRRQADQELEDELRDHVERKAEQYVAKGLDPKQARRQALLEMGGIEKRKEECRDKRHVNWIQDLIQDLHFSVRILRKSPGFTTVAILTLALGIGANAAIFSIVDWLLLRPLPVANAQQVTYLVGQGIREGYSSTFSYPDFVDIRKQSAAVFSDVAGVHFDMDGLSVAGNDVPIWTSYVTGDFFEMMGLKPALGNLIEPAAGRSVGTEPVLVLGYSFWQVHFGGDSKVMSKSVLINGHPVTIIGVAPKGFHGATPALDIQGYLPLRMGAVTSDLESNFVTDRKSDDVQVIARLKRGVKLGDAQPLLSVIAHRLSTQYPITDKLASIQAYPLGQMGPTDPSSLGAIRLIGVLFLILAGLVLLLACLNVANLLLTRASGRQREMAVRAALGGGRNRLIRQLLAESLLLALLGCAAGIALGLISSRWLGSINLHAGAIPLVLDFQFDWRVFAYAFGIALLTALLVGIAPALRATQGNLNNLLHEGARSATAGRQRARGVLVLAQVGGSLVLLIVAGLFVRSLWKVQHSNLGFNPQGVLNFTIDAHEAGYNEAQARNFLQSLLPRVRALPGVETASVATTVPMGYYSFVVGLKIEGYQPPSDQRAPSAGYRAVSPGYFKTMRIPIVRGRSILDSDGQSSPHVAVINEVMAEKYWHSEDPIGRRFTAEDDPKNSIEVVGVAKNSRADDLLTPIGPYMYVPLAQHYQTPVTLQLRTSLPLATMSRQVVGVIHSLAPMMPVLDIQTMNEALDTINGLLLFQLGAALAASLGFLGVALAIVGVYGVVSYGASQRTHEIGIRMALGAQQAQILKMIFRQGVGIVGGGMVVGVLAAAGIARLVGNFLSGVSPIDPLTYLSASLSLATIALLASYIPARRAMRVDPMVALRHE